MIIGRKQDPPKKYPLDLPPWWPPWWLFPPPPPVWLCSGLEINFGTYMVGNPYPASLATPQGITFEVDPPTPIQIEERKKSYLFGMVVQSFVALHCGNILKIDLGQDCQFVDLMYLEGGGVIDGFDARHTLVLNQTVPDTRTPTVVNLVPHGPLRYLEINRNSSNKMFLLKLCAKISPSRPPLPCSGSQVDLGDYSVGSHPAPLITAQGLIFEDDDHVSGPPPTPTRIEYRHGFVALHCGYLLKIDLGQDYQVVELIHYEGPGVIYGFDAQRKRVLEKQVLKAPNPALASLTTPEGPMRYLEITNSSNEMFLLKMCCHN